MLVKHCERCQAEFRTKRPKQRFCCTRCGLLKHHLRICKSCHQSFHPIRAEQIYCCKECARLGLIKVSWETIQALALEGLSESTIARQLGISTSRVCSILHKHGFGNPRSRFGIPLTPTQRSLVIGGLLGDASGVLTPNNRGRIKFRHGPKQYAYLDWKYEIMRNLVNTPPKTIPTPSAYGSESRIFTTLTNMELTTIISGMYATGKKRVTFEYLNQVDNLALAVWFMDDGSSGKSDGGLSTHGFDHDENRLITIWLSNRFECPEPRLQLDKRCMKYSIRLHAEILYKLYDAIRPYIPECMKYKIKR